jgi:hypothetical protein
MSLTSDSCSRRRLGAPGWPRRAGCSLAVATWVLVAVNSAQAASPPAGTSITSQAPATYNDSSGVSHTVISNLVQICTAGPSAHAQGQGPTADRTPSPAAACPAPVP